MSEKRRQATPQEVRERIDTIRNERARLCFRFQYLTASRIGEVVGSTGATADDYQRTTYQEHEVALFMVKREKTPEQGQRISAIALPLDAKYEPWTKSLVELFERTPRGQCVFQVTTRAAQMWAQGYEEAQGAFNNLWYWVDPYGQVRGHWKQLSTHGLRHIRPTELMTRYGFDGIDLAIYCGWSLGREVAMPKVATRYLYGQWIRYFPKLLKPF